MQVPERRVVGRGREDARRHLVLERGLHVALAAATQAAKERRVRHHDVDAVRGELLGERADDRLNPALVVEGVLGVLVEEQLGSADGVAL